MTDRSALPSVRNPILGLSSAAALKQLPDESRTAVRNVLLDLSTDAKARANRCWQQNKAPMAAYWKAVSVYSRHIARAIDA